MTTAVSPRAFTVVAESMSITFGSVDTTVMLTGVNGFKRFRERAAVYTNGRYGGSVVRRVVGIPPCTRLAGSGVIGSFAVT